MRRRAAGQILVQTLVFASLGAVVLGSIVQWVFVMVKASRASQHAALAAQVAEAGIEYYRWHLAHAPTDYRDGTGQPGPYVHPYRNAAGDVIGSFTLTITPPPIGSTVVTIKSRGVLTAAPTAPQTVEVQMAIPSLAKFAVVANDTMRFGAGTEVFGPIHSNGGIRFDGLAHNLVTSADDRYDDPDHTGSEEWAVHTHLAPTDPLPPTALASRPDVFEAGRGISVPAVDFSGFTANLAAMKTAAQANGRYFAASGGLGYRIVLKVNDTFDLYRVNSTQNPPSNCTDVQDQEGWGTWSVNGQTFLNTYAFPANGILFVEDHLWISGTVNTARLSVAAARFPDNPSTRRNIIVNNDLRYTNYDGQDVLALIAQNDFTVGMNSEDDLRVDAALIAQHGRVGRYYYRPPGSGQNRCSPYHERQRITLYGMIGTNERYGFAYTDGNGYQERDIIYDANLLYSPPPSFPLTTDQYVTISWKRKKD